VAFIRRHINILFVFILPVYFYIVQNSIQNKHTHVYANGIVVTHAHPINKGGESPINEHKHSEREICLYSSLHFDLYDALILIQLEVDLKEICTNYFIANDEVISYLHFSNSIPRGPPVLCS